MHEVRTSVAVHVPGVTLLEADHCHVGVGELEVLVRAEVRIALVHGHCGSDSLSPHVVTAHEDVLLAVTVEILDVEVADGPAGHEAVDAILALGAHPNTRS